MPARLAITVLSAIHDEYPSKQSAPSRLPNPLQRGEFHDFHEQFFHVEVRGHERFLQSAHSVCAIRQQWLFYDMMKQLLDKCALGLRAANGEFGHVPWAGKTD